MKKLLVKFLVCAIATLTFAELAQAMPAEVLLLRHGEKPEDGNELNDRGWERAKALPNFFHKRAEIERLGAPVALYGMAPKKKKGSVRAIQTLKYLADDFHLRVIDDFTDEEVDEMVKEVSEKKDYDGKFVVICWNHDSMHDIAKEFGVKHAPKYSKDAFDRAWLIRFDGEKASLEDLPQRLLPGDSAN